MPEPDLDMLRYALSVARNHGYCEVQVEAGDSHFEAKLDLAAARSASLAFDASLDLAQIAAPSSREITATLVGYYQEAQPPLQIGRKVDKGEVVAVISALGLANDVEASVSGEVIEVLVKAGEPVEFGQVLARVGE